VANLLGQTDNIDADGDTLSYLWNVRGPEGSQQSVDNPTSATTSFTPDVRGFYFIELIVDDGQATDQASVRLRAYTVDNQAPIAAATVPSTVRVDEFVRLDGGASYDPDGDAILGHGWFVASQPARSEVFLGPRNIATPQFSATKAGRYVIRYGVSDGVLESEPVDFVILVGDNLAPIANAGSNVVVNLGDLVALNGSLSSDPEDNTLTYRWTIEEKPDSSVTELTGPLTINPSFTPDVEGQYLIQLIVNDGVNDSLPATVSVTVEDLNEPPTAIPLNTSNPAIVNEAVIIDGSQSSDANNDPLSYAWSWISRPVGSTATLGDTTAAQTTFTPDLTGVYRLSLVVSDGQVSSTAAGLTIVVTNDPASNSLPVAFSGFDQVVLEGTELFLSGGFSQDLDGDLLTYAWTVEDKPIESQSVLSDPTVIGPTIEFDVTGVYTISLSVNDGIASSPADSVNITVIEDTFSAPPDPGELGRSTIVGIDTDSDGIRDDVQRMIYANYGDSGAQNLALQQFARAYQFLLSSYNDLSQQPRSLSMLYRAVECLVYLNSGNQNTADDHVFSQIMNTLERNQAYELFYRELSGKVLYGNKINNWENSCD